MKQETKDYIERVAYSVRTMSNTQTPINNIEALINKMGGKLEAASDADIATRGRIRKEGNKFVIRYLDGLTNQKDINWVVARMLGHLVLHLGWGANPKHWHSLPDDNFVLKPNDAQKEQSVLFAMNLLLPESHLELVFEEMTKDREDLGFEDLDIVAEYFCVPTLRVFQRLTDLEMIE